MDIEIVDLLDEITDSINEDSLIKEYRIKKKEVLEDSELTSKIGALKKLDIYSNEYKKLKEEITSNKKFSKYKELEAEVYLLLLTINKKLNRLRCEDEDNNREV